MPNANCTAIMMYVCVTVDDQWSTISIGVARKRPIECQWFWWEIYLVKVREMHKSRHWVRKTIAEQSIDDELYVYVVWLLRLIVGPFDKLDFNRFAFAQRNKQNSFAVVAVFAKQTNTWCEHRAQQPCHLKYITVILAARSSAHNDSDLHINLSTGGK